MTKTAAIKPPLKEIKVSQKLKKRKKFSKAQFQFYLILLPGILYYIIFTYVPMGGLVVAFKDYSLWKGILASDWVGLQHFTRFFDSPEFFNLFKNTLLLGLYSLVWSFPFPVIFALFLNEIKSVKLKKITQTVSYLPTFLSTVIISSMVIDLLSPQNGLINDIIAFLGFERHYFMMDPAWFRTIYIGSGIWSGFGSGAIIYIAALASVDTQLYEAAEIDGASRLQKIYHVSLPAIIPTITTMLIISSGDILRVGYEKVLLLQNPATYTVSDVFQTYVYRIGIRGADYSFATAVGVFESVISLILVAGTNYISRKTSESSLW